MRKLKKTTFAIRGEFETLYEPNSYIIDLNKKTIVKNPNEFHQKTYGGKLWVDGSLLTFRKSQELLRTKEGEPFSWGHTGICAHIASMAICLRILKNPQISLNICRAFMETYVATWPMTNFETSIDITDFLIDNRTRLSPLLHTHIFRARTISLYHELDIILDPASLTLSTNLLDQVVRDFTSHIADQETRNEKKKMYYRKFAKFFGKNAVISCNALFLVRQKADEVLEDFYRSGLNRIISSLKQSLEKYKKQLD
jgi:hypothetical protein